MTSPSQVNLESLPAAARQQIRAVCLSFVQQWKAGQTPRTEQLLQDGPVDERDVLLRELLRLEMRFRLQRGECLLGEEFLQRFPDQQDLIRFLLTTVGSPEQDSPRTSVADRQAKSSVTERPQPVSSHTERPKASWPEIPGYRIEAELGKGGMGVVYKAQHLLLDRTVALKTILAGAGADEAELTRFRIEVRAVARLQHPNVVQIFEVGEHDGLPFFCLEFCPQGSLASKLKRNVLPPRKAAHLVEQIARGMHAAHQQGIIHRDLKPANVLLTEDGTPRVADFGLAKKLDEQGQTATEAVMGTPSYMAPEQASGQSRQVGPAADVYALGAILYECLTGRSPFKAASAWETIQQVLTVDPVPPRQLARSLPRELETICLKCLEKNPARRYASAEELAEELRRWQAGEPISARPVGRLEQAVKWARRKPTAAALAAVSVLALLVVLVGGGLFTLFLTQQRDRAVKAEEKAEQRADDANQARQQALRDKESALLAQKTALRHAAGSAYDSGQQLCERGEVSQGLHWLARALEHARSAGDADLEAAARWNLGVWSRELHTLALVLPHPGEKKVNAVAFHPEGKIIATGSAAGIVRLWDGESGQATGQMLRLPKPIRSLVWQPGGKSLGIVSVDGFFRLWQPEAAEPKLTLRITGNDYWEYYWRPMAFHPDGTKGPPWRKRAGEGLRHGDGTADGSGTAARSGKSRGRCLEPGRQKVAHGQFRRAGSGLGRRHRQTTRFRDRHGKI